MLLVHDRVRHNTALHYAVEGGNPECVRLLLSAAAHTAPATEGTQQRGPTERQLLLAAGNHAGLTALHYAVHEDKFDAIKLLLSYGADINAQVRVAGITEGRSGTLPIRPQGRSHRQGPAVEAPPCYIAHELQGGQPCAYVLCRPAAKGLLRSAMCLATSMLSAHTSERQRVCFARCLPIGMLSALLTQIFALLHLAPDGL